MGEVVEKPGLRILVMPTPNTKSFFNNGLFLGVRELMEFAKASDRKAYFYLFTPDFVAEGLKEFPDYDKLVVGSFPTVGDKWDYPYLLPMFDLHRLFGRRQGVYPIDAVLTDNAGAALMLMRGLSDIRRRGENEDLPIFVIEGGVSLSRAPHRWEECVDAVTECVGYAVSHPIFLTTREQEMARKQMALHLSPSRVAGALRKSLVCPLPVQCEKIDEAVKGIERNKKFTVFFGGRLNDSKRFDLILESYEYLFKFGRPIDIVITTGNGSSSFVDSKQYPHVKFHFNCARSDYWKEAAKTHLFVCASEEEGFSVGFFEQLYIGMIGMFQDFPWVRGCLPKNYPFIYRTNIERDAMLRKIYEDPVAAQKSIAWVPQWVKDTYRPGVVYKRMWEFMQGACDEKKKIFWSGTFKKLVDKAARALGEKFTLDELCTKMGELADSKVAFGADLQTRSRVPGRWEIVQLVSDLGWLDNCADRDPVFQPSAKVLAETK